MAVAPHPLNITVVRLAIYDVRINRFFKHLAEDIYIHPDFNYSMPFYRDIALIRLATPSCMRPLKIKYAVRIRLSILPADRHGNDGRRTPPSLLG